ncbi:MAG: methyltransferase domain-containing protein [Deltaproteobacteria bacterium]|nr:methyltransferase domain-containing protein [Deltaproteobacteria bacterium]
MEDKYELEVVPITIGGKRLELQRIANWDIFVRSLEKEGEEYIRKFPFWVKIWEASIVLVDHLVGTLPEEEMEILEIGAGMGVTGLFLAALGHRVTITDYEDEALELLRINAERNGLENVSVKKLDWNDPQLQGKYDIICGSELVYKETSIQPVMSLFQTYLRPEGTIFLAHDVERRCLVQFIGMVPGRFEIENIVKQFRGEGKVHRIVVHSFRIK